MYVKLYQQVASSLVGTPGRSHVIDCRAQVVLRPMDAGLTTIGVEGDDKGGFVVRNIAPGRYTHLVRRVKIRGQVTSGVTGVVLQMPS